MKGTAVRGSNRRSPFGDRVAYIALIRCPCLRTLVYGNYGGVDPTLVVSIVHLPVGTNLLFWGPGRHLSRKKV